MELSELIDQTGGFSAMTTRQKICLFGWFLHIHRGAQTFSNADIRQCFRKADLAAPDVSVYLPRLADSKPADLVRERGAYRLERTVRLKLDAKYGSSPSTVAVMKVLTNLPAKVPDHAESAFLTEALNCYKVRAFRAATVMAWNLAFSHLLRWILADNSRLAAFNAALPKRFPKKCPPPVIKIEDFEELREAETIEVCQTASLFSKNIIAILKEKLKRRNVAAHPSAVVVEQAQADDTITDLVNNVILALQ